MKKREERKEEEEKRRRYLDPYQHHNQYHRTARDVKRREIEARRWGRYSDLNDSIFTVITMEQE